MEHKPKRPRSHELETESQRAFEHALPASLVVRPVTDDYGVDREVEVFEDGEATGLTFKVQLKGTDKSGSSRRVASTALEYWRSLDVPVLIVSFEAPSGMLRACWAHSVPTSVSDDGSVPSKITVHMNPSIQLDDQWSSGLGRDLMLVRELRRGSVPNPLPVRLDVSKSLDDLDRAVLIGELLRGSRRGLWPMVASSSDDPALTISISPSLVRATLPLDWASVSMTATVCWETHPELRRLARDLIVLTATALVPVNESSARAVALAGDPTGDIWTNTEVAERLGPVMAHEDSATFLSEIISALTSAQLTTGSGLPISELYEHWFLDFVDNLTDEQLRNYSSTRRANALMSDRSWETGRQIYNLAHIHKAKHDYERAIDLFREAAEHDPRYATYSDYLRYLAGCEWEVAEYEQSAADYRSAIGAGFDPAEGLPLLADSLMHAGRYREASDALAPWMPRGDDRDRLGILRQLALDHIISYLGLTSQQRQVPGDVQQQFATALAADDEGAALRKLLRDTDALAPLPWLALVDEKNLASSFEHVLIAAMMTEDFTQAWITTFICALDSEADEEVIQAVVNQARFHCGEEFYDAVWEAAEQQEDSNANYMRQVIAVAYAAEPSTLGKTMRFVNPPGVGGWVAYEIRIDGYGSLLSNAAAPG